MPRHITHMRNGKPFRPPKPRPWQECWCVSLEWTGNKVQVLPLIEYIVKRNSDHSGSFLIGPPLCDAMWDKLGPRTARGLYRRLENIVKGARWFGYVRLRLLHDWHAEKKMKCEQQLKRGKIPKFPHLKLRKRSPRKKVA